MCRWVCTLVGRALPCAVGFFTLMRQSITIMGVFICTLGFTTTVSLYFGGSGSIPTSVIPSTGGSVILWVRSLQIIVAVCLCDCSDSGVKVRFHWKI